MVSHFTRDIHFARAFQVNKLAGNLFLVLLFISLALPSGYIVSIPNFKIFTFTGVIILLLLGKFFISRRHTMAMALFVFFLYIETINGIITLGHAALPLAQLKSISVTLAIPWITYVMLKNNAITPKHVFSAIVYSTLAVALIKIGLIIYAAEQKINFIELTRVIGSYFDYQIMTMHIAGPFYRFQVTTDLADPVAIYILLMGKDLGLRNVARSVFALPLLACILFSGFLAYSRYTWAFMAIALLMATAGSKVARGLLVVAVVIFIPAYSVIAFRFFSGAVTVSDNIRLQELSVLLSEFYRAPILGHGLGFYVPTFISDKYNKYSYELQWVAALMQVGVIGVMVFLAPLLLLARYVLLTPFNARGVRILSLFIFWVASGLFSPNLTSSAAGVIFSFFVAAGYQMRGVFKSEWSS